jgi:hypothetical protein
MKTMRRALRKTWLSGGLALSLAYLLVLQGLLASRAQGTMAAASTGPQTVICTSGGLVEIDPAADRDIPGKDALRWHCATLCQMASAGVPAILGAQTGGVPAPRRQAIAIAFTPSDMARSAFKGLIAEARAPPFSI